MKIGVCCRLNWQLAIVLLLGGAWPASGAGQLVVVLAPDVPPASGYIEDFIIRTTYEKALREFEEAMAPTVAGQAIGEQLKCLWLAPGEPCRDVRIVRDSAEALELGKHPLRNALVAQVLLTFKREKYFTMNVTLAEWTGSTTPNRRYLTFYRHDVGKDIRKANARSKDDVVIKDYWRSGLPLDEGLSEIKLMAQILRQQIAPGARTCPREWETRDPGMLFPPHDAAFGPRRLMLMPAIGGCLPGLGSASVRKK